ncbi:hypothetical protein GCM10011613_19610 [Cellvibrio zantedeschiae]|uniref:RDD domain-containing protein n=1 Tax=Cellvibrio zantedeschiae TaxID=1237077 RepID=A0ABQ3B247_9GAMM|nr:RDD family protein [Cellvibrio zantedeschiae]GGY74307.1 hypothetical protein GCM10011613_19610 [Cellvibrio zantedeschiae]
MNDQQPEGFQPSSATGGDNTASYNKRFLAFVIDVFLIAVMLMFFMQYLGIDPGQAADMQSAQAELIKKLAALSDSQKMLLTFSPMISFFLLHGYLLYHQGQTVGKKVMGIAIVTLDNQKPAFMALIAQRYFSQWIMGMVPVIGVALRLADVLLIFRRDKRCLHDLIARTKVIDLSVKVAVTPNSFVA